MTTYAPSALTARSKKDASREETPLRFRVFAGVYAALALGAVAFLALVPVVALS
jgi:hypothetical protein